MEAIILNKTKTYIIREYRRKRTKNNKICVDIAINLTDAMYEIVNETFSSKFSEASLHLPKSMAPNTLHTAHPIPKCVD